MDILESLERLARRASQEEPPVFGVTEAVRLRISSAVPKPLSIIPLGLVGGLSAVAASVVAFLAVQAWAYMSSPLMQLLAPLPEIPSW